MDRGPGMAKAKRTGTAGSPLAVLLTLNIFHMNIIMYS